MLELPGLRFRPPRRRARVLRGRAVRPGLALRISWPSALTSNERATGSRRRNVLATPPLRSTHLHNCLKLWAFWLNSTLAKWPPGLPGHPADYGGCAMGLNMGQPASKRDKAGDNSLKRCRIRETGRNGMFEISGFDTAGVVSLKRASLAAALKKARELVEDGCWDVQIVDPTGRVYSSFEEQAA